MTLQQIIFLTVVFVAVVLATLGVMALFSAGPVRARLMQLAGQGKELAIEGGGGAPVMPPQWRQKIVDILGPAGKLSLPSEGWETSPQRQRFMHAGYRSENAPLVFYGAKTVLTFLLPVLFMVYSGVRSVPLENQIMMMWIFVLAAVGYYVPNLYLSRRIFLRKREVFENLPDAIDLMMICVEAGLGLDAAIARVAQEIRLKSEILADEMHLVGLELRAGATRERALRNLAMRTGVEEVDLLVTMLVQADRFGTSIADSLRVHADSLRTKRRQRAEEAAAKIAVKLLFPLIFCIFPSMMLVLLGPAFISIYRVLLPTMGGN
ncbi:MAG: type II secretion system F family protein [Thiobacillus sp.]|jgi:tight adherence protein C|uniref:type II secretion system F family protein n=1 Tax=Thiobacillus sp. TaxID=924 RepID=UPI002895D88F|nr:type II secretion system F family protein [Thiobacillus sp.]MDT3708257.1 type II secretion system F family protein [Thiobacillus sp.]